MRLIHAKTREMRSFAAQASDILFPRYAILSHTWEDEEITYQEFIAGFGLEKKSGFRKITSCLAQAQKDGLDWVWVDTCCIDKTSSAELSEAINTMYKWYESATVCYALINDYDIKRLDMDSETLRSCRWFSRGWTLQELVAPVHVVFYDRHWIEMGTKSSMADTLAEATGVPAEVLRHTVARRSVPVADRMSWAGGRSTTRIEDGAYCLLGIFDVNMPLLYGEGTRAFSRLQAEVIRTAHDDTIFLGGLEQPRRWDKIRGRWNQQWRHQSSPSGRWLSSPEAPGKGIAVPDPRALRIETPALNGNRLRIDLPLMYMRTDAVFQEQDPWAANKETSPDWGSAEVAYGALNCLSRRGDGSPERLARVFKIISNTQDSAGPVLHLQPFDGVSCWFPAIETASWQVTRCIISMDDAPTYALGTPGYREKRQGAGLQMSTEQCRLCKRQASGWTWARRHLREHTETERMNHTYLLQQKRPSGKIKAGDVAVGLIFLVPTRAEDGACRIGMFELPPGESAAGEMLNRVWEAVQAHAANLMAMGEGGQEGEWRRSAAERAVGGVWSVPLVEGVGPRASVSCAFASCCFEKRLVATMFCGQTSKGDLEFSPELKFETFKDARRVR